jgi:hypothetical protein
MNVMTSAIALVTMACSSVPPRGAALANSAPTRPSSIAGDYRTPHTVSMVCEHAADGWCDEQVEDTLVIRDRHDGAIAVHVELVRTNAHTCSFEGTLGPVSEGRWRFDHGDDDGPCRLTLEHAGNELRLSADGCRYYCGARASLDAVFAQPR